MFMSRRSFLNRLGAGAAALALQPPRIPAFAGPSGAPGAIKIIDSARDVSDQAGLIRYAGISTVIRYYARNDGQWPGKVLSPTERAVLEEHGLSLAVIFQHNNSNPLNFMDGEKKKLDAQWALTHAERVGQPKGTPIYFGADFNLRPEHEDAVKAYFEYVASALAGKGYEVGIYGCGAACALVGGIAQYFWLSASVGYAGSSSFYNSGDWHLFQNKIELPKPYASQRPEKKADRVIDTDVLNDRFEYFGQWRTDGTPVVHSKAQSAAILALRAFVTTAPNAVLYKRRSGTWEATGKTIDYARNVRLLGRRGDYVALSLDEGDDVQGYCRASDLSCNLGKMPPYSDKTQGAELACE